MGTASRGIGATLGLPPGRIRRSLSSPRKTTRQKKGINGIHEYQAKHDPKQYGPDPKPSFPELSASQSCQMPHSLPLGSRQGSDEPGLSVGRTYQIIAHAAGVAAAES